MTFDRFLHKLWYLHFSKTHNAADTTDTNCDNLWKTRHLTDMLYSYYSKYYALSEHLAVNEVTVPFKERITFLEYTPSTNTDE
jgi:hypothetical protein